MNLDLATASATLVTLMMPALTGFRATPWEHESPSPIAASTAHGNVALAPEESSSLDVGQTAPPRDQTPRASTGAESDDSLLHMRKINGQVDVQVNPRMCGAASGPGVESEETSIASGSFTGNFMIDSNENGVSTPSVCVDAAPLYVSLSTENGCGAEYLLVTLMEDLEWWRHKYYGTMAVPASGNATREWRSVTPGNCYHLELRVDDSGCQTSGTYTMTW